MKRFIAALALSSPLIASALPCEKMEFAELQSKNGKELEFRYCDSLMSAGFEHETFQSRLDFSSKFAAMGARGDAAKAQREAQAAADNASQCRGEAVRAYTAYMKKTKKTTIDCSKVIPTWNKDWELDHAAKAAPTK